MKGIKALTEDCRKYLQFKPSGPILLTVSQLEELEESRSRKPFILNEDGSWSYRKDNGELITVKPLRIGS